jgi:PAS domain S-box-containing protein
MATPGGKDREEPRARRRAAPSGLPFDALFTLFIENVRDYAIFIIDPRGCALTWNAGVQRMLGYAESEFLGLDVRRIFRVSDAHQAEREMARAAATGRSEDERWHVRKDGTEIWVTGVLTALRDSAGRLRGYAKIMRDSTADRHAALERDELLRRELAARGQAEQANRMKDEFLAMVSHELRTPLNAILGWARMLRTGELDEARRDRAVETIERNARAQSQLVGDLLDISRIVTGKLQLDVGPVSIQQLLRAAVESVDHAADAKDIRLSVAISGEPAPVEGDPARLTQVVLNLLSNAIKFTPSGGRVDVHLHRREDDVELTVCDTGQGMRPDELPQVFTRFHQAATGRRPAGGLGLGLAIARHIVEAHGGTIEARSEGPGRGACFVVRLPQARGLTMPAAALRESEDLTLVVRPRILAGKSALVVEDQIDSLELIGSLLEHCGMRVRTATSVGGALDAIARQETALDLIVSDIALDDQADGCELMRTVRSRPGPIGRVPAIAVSAHASRDDRMRALAAGYELHLAKPVEPVDLIKAAATLLETHGASDDR